jgi:vitamin B12 transporter
MNGISFVSGGLSMKYLFFLTSSLVLATPALAQEGEELVGPATLRNETITVVASGTQQQLNQTGQSIGVIGKAEIDSIQGSDLTRVLQRLPGVSVVRTGPLGGQTSLFVRGANSDQVLILLDGVKLADYASPGGNYDFGNLLAGNIERVDLLRGSNSVVWGSQAIGGVLSITTREVDGAEFAGEYGAYDTVYLTGTAGIRRDDYAASLSAGYVHSDGFSAKSGGTEPDGFRQWVVSGKGRVTVADGLTLRANGRYADGKLDVDQTGPNAPDLQFTQEGSARLGIDYEGDGFGLSGGYTYSAVRRDYQTGFGPSFFKGHGQRAELFGHVDLPSEFRLDFGADSEWMTSESTYDGKAKARLSSGHALLGYYTDAVSLAAGVRVDDHSIFGIHWTFGANGSVAIVDGWRLRASYGEGFKAPTLYQLYAGFGTGNINLKPEQSRSYEVGIEKGDRNAPLHLALTWFRRDARNLIDTDVFFQYQNTFRARSEGVEVELGAQLGETLRAQATYTWLNARDLTLGRDLARRPRHTVTATLDWQTPLDILKLGVDLRMASKSVDYAFGGGVLPMGSYVVGTLRAEVAVHERVSLFGRIENIGDEKYQVASGFNTAGRSAYAGVKARF